MSFKESIILPISALKSEIVKKKRPRKVLKKEVKDKIPIDVRMKLLQQKRHLAAKKMSSPSRIILPIKEKKDISHLVESVPLNKQPFAQSILQKILENENIISWDEQNHLLINNKTIPSTNIKTLLKFVTDSLII